MDKNIEIKASILYDSTEQVDKETYIVGLDGKKAFLTQKNGIAQLSQWYTDIEHLNNSCYNIVKKGKKLGIVTNNEHVILECMHTDITGFTGKHFIAAVDKNKFGLISITGDVVIPYYNRKIKAYKCYNNYIVYTVYGVFNTSIHNENLDTIFSAVSIGEIAVFERELFIERLENSGYIVINIETLEKEIVQGSLILQSSGNYKFINSETKEEKILNSAIEITRRT